MGEWPVWVDASHYVAVAPRNLRPESDYTLLISVSDAQGDVHVQGQIAISYLPEKQKEDQVLSQSVNISNGETGELRFFIDSSVVDSHSINLTIEGSGGLTFNNETSMVLESVARLTFIQTDKATYKAKDVVRFRVFTTLPDLTPLKIPKTIRVKNPAGSALQKYNDDGNNMVFEGEYKVFSSPELGDYKIEVEYDKGDFKEERSFKVDEYVPPKFEVEADVHPKFLVDGEGSDVTVNVKATYTYGKPVRGKVVVASEDDVILAENEMDGTQDIIVDLKRMKSPEGYPTEKTVNIYVNVTDETNSNVSTTVSVKITKNKAKMEFDKTLSDQVYRVGPVKVVVKVTDPVGGLLADSVEGSLKLTVNTGSGSNKSEQVLFLEEGRNGFYTWIVEDLPSDVYTLYFDAQLTIEGQKDTLNSSLNIPKYQTIGTASMNAKWTSESHEMWGTAEFTVDLNSENDWRLDSFWYMIISRGSVLRQETMPNRNAVISITRDMCPVAEIIVFGMTTSSTPELIADRLKLELKGCLKKQVTTRSVPREETGQKVYVDVDVSWTDPKEQGPVGEHKVFLLGVDKSMVLLQEQNNDITPDRVEEELKKIEMGSAEEDHMFGRRRKRTVTPGPEQSTPVSTGALLKKLGLAILTDVDMSFKRNQNGGAVMMMAAAGVAPQNYGMKEADVADERGGRMTVPPKTVVRKDFPDTWIFESGMTNVDGDFSMQKKLPDSITSWVISAFAIKDGGEIAATKDPFEINVYNPFFVTMTLPYSIRRTEILVLRCTVFSYEDFDRDTVVTLMGTKDFDIIGKSTWREKVVRNTVKSVEFKVKATTVKTINITVRATGRPIASNAPDYTDIVTKTLIVEPEGEKHIRTKTFPLSVEGDFIEKHVWMNFPPNTVDQSRKIVAKITGDMMGTVLNNIDDLIRKPYGCGEQNMITVVPNIAAMTYLTAVGANTREFSEKAIKYMTDGYHREQNYRWSKGIYNGGFSAFGTSDDKPSTWLSAFVLKSFSQASHIIAVDRESLMETVAFLMRLEKEGRFVKLGSVIHGEMQGGTAAGGAFDVYIIMCLLEARKMGFEVSPERLDLAFDNSLGRASEEPQKKHPFLAALMAYTLTLKEPNNPRVTDLLRHVNDSSPPWRDTDKKEPKQPEVDPLDYHKQYDPSAIEITSYCILAYVNIGDIRAALPLVMWLQKQQNDKGGFSSTQDTMVALQAIAAYAALSSSTPNSVIHLYSPGKVDITKEVNENNRRILQIVELPSDITQLTVRATGQKSFTVVKIVWSFHTKPKDRKTRLDLTSRGILIRFNVIEYINCLMVHGGNDGNTMGMHVMTLIAPSGMGVNNPLEVKQQNHAQYIEHDKNTLHIYLDEPSEETCFTITMNQEVKVEHRLPGLAFAYNYYNSDEIYNSVELMPLDDDGGCKSCPTGCATTLTSVSHLLLTAVICLLTSLVLAM